ncbi:MAG: cytochrome P450, partial [Bacteriovorax sp.]|nr:cytochrome P450 [Bacteriovorax sp.]
LILSNSFLESIVQETFRIKPPVPFINRKVINRKFLFGTKELSIDDELGVCILLLNQQADVWSRPFDFMADRFLERKFSPFEFAPFGGGARKCIGSELATMELKMLIGLCLSCLNLDLIEESSPSLKVMQITVGPKKPIYVTFKKKN